jgi:hypothetical protein
VNEKGLGLLGSTAGIEVVVAGVVVLLADEGAPNEKGASVELFLLSFSAAKEKSGAEAGVVEVLVALDVVVAVVAAGIEVVLLLVEGELKVNNGVDVVVEVPELAAGLGVDVGVAVAAVEVPSDGLLGVEAVATAGVPKLNGDAVVVAAAALEVLVESAGFPNVNPDVVVIDGVTVLVVAGVFDDPKGLGAGADDAGVAGLSVVPAVLVLDPNPNEGVVVVVEDAAAGLPDDPNEKAEAGGVAGAAVVVVVVDFAGDPNVNPPLEEVLVGAGIEIGAVPAADELLIAGDPNEKPLVVVLGAVEVAVFDDGAAGALNEIAED